MDNPVYTRIRFVGIGLILLSLGWAIYGGLTSKQVPGTGAFKQAESHFSSGNYEAALKGYEESLKQAPDFVPAIHARGRTLMILDRFEEALADFDRAISLQPDFAVSYINRAILNDKLGRYEEALGDYEQAFKLEPELAKESNGFPPLKTNANEKMTTMESRAEYLREQLALPMEKRELPFPKEIEKSPS